MNFTSAVIRRISLSAILLTALFPVVSKAQNTLVKGKVTDASTHEPLSYVSITVIGSGKGSSTDADGNYSISIPENYHQLKFSYIGYQNLVRDIGPGTEHKLDIELEANPNALAEVVVKSRKRAPYHNKNNPSVELIQKVIARKAQNQISNYNYASYNEYEKVQLFISNPPSKLLNKKFLQPYRFMLDNRDTTTVKGKSLIPLYMEEKISDNYYRKNPEKKKAVITAQKKVNIEQYLDSKGIDAYLSRIYSDINIYSNNIYVVTNQMLSPVADAAPTFYKYFIVDTITDNQQKLIELAFFPRNKTDLLFQGKLFITTDGNYAVKKAELTINKDINLNWVRQLNIKQNFEADSNGKYYLSESTMQADFGLLKNNSAGIFGERTVIYKNYRINQPQPDSFYTGEPVVVASGSAARDNSFWQQNRPDTLSPIQEKVYANIDALNKMPSFQKVVKIGTLLGTGFVTVKNIIDVGPVSSFYSFNPVEGTRLKFGGRTTTGFSSRYYLDGYTAYGFTDQQWKYQLGFSYALNNKSVYTYPLNYIRASYQHDTQIPGENLQFAQDDGFIFSFTRGNNDKWLYNDIWMVNYIHEYENHFSYSLGVKNWKQEPAGTLQYNTGGSIHPVPVQSLTTTEFALGLRYAPHEQFMETRLYRNPIVNRYPVLNLSFTGGFKDLLKSGHNYQNITGSISKRFFLSQLGYTDVKIGGAYIFGQAPFPLLAIHPANQSYIYQSDSYNMMNFMEFVSDHYASLNLDHYFNGFFMNKIPLLKKLKLREIATFKMIYGGIRDENNPQLNPSLLSFPTTLDGIPYTYSLSRAPYMEGGIGLSNIFKIFRVDLVKRFNYLSNPDVSQLGLRVATKMDF